MQSVYFVVKTCSETNLEIQSESVVKTTKNALVTTINFPKICNKNMMKTIAIFHLV